MKNYETDFTKLRQVEIGDINAYVLTPKLDRDVFKTIIFYHGWGSCAKNQIFRANIFASYGYQVVIPEARNHGERGSVNYFDEEIFRDYFPATIMHNIEEFPEVYRYVVENLNTDEDSIAIGGHSMGAITSSALFAFKKNLKAALLFNGVGDWNWIINSLGEKNEVGFERQRRNEFLRDMNPMNQLEELKDRPILMYNGEVDESVDPNAQEKFYNAAREVYSNKDLIEFKKFEATPHMLTTQMLEGAIIFLKQVAKF